MESLFNHERNMDEHDLVIDHDSNSWSSSSSSINGEDGGEEVNSSSPLQDMSSLLLQLPLKRGLSKHYNGKSQSFTSLSSVKSVEDLAKQQNPFNKKLKTCKSYGRGFAKKHTNSSSKKGPLNMGSHLFSRFNGRRNSTFFNINNSNNKPPIPPPHRSTSSLIF